MKKLSNRYARLLILFILTGILFTVVFIGNFALRQLHSASPDAGVADRGIVFLTEENSSITEDDSYSYHYLFPAEYDEDRVLILYDPFYYQLESAGGNQTASFEAADPFTYFHILPLTEDYYDSGLQAYEFRIQFTGPNTAGLHFATRDMAELLTDAQLFLRHIMIGICIFSSLSLLVLYLCKRDQKYLLFLFLYSLVLTVFAVSGIPWFTQNPVISNILYNSLVYYMTPLFIFKVYTLRNIGFFADFSPYPDRFKPVIGKMLRLPFQLSLFLILVLVSYFIDEDFFSFLISAIYGIFGFLELYVFIRRKQKGLFLLIFGYASSFALFILNILYLYDFICLSLPLEICMSSCLLELPFLLASFIYVLMRYGHVFTELQETSLSLQETNAHLDNLVEEKTRQLTEEQAEKHNLMMNIFHDLRTPVFIIKEYTALIRNQLTPEQDDLRDEVLIPLQNRITFLSNFIEDIFLVSKLENNSLLMAEDHVDAARLLSGIAADCRVECQEKEITFHSDIQADCILWGDELRLTQAIQNLTSNAVHYTKPHGSVTLRAFIREQRLVIIVRDTGIGISEYDLPNIFKRYFRADRGRTGNQDSSSTGLGLSIAHEIIEKHLGTISVESIPGQGTSFEVTLPCKTSTESLN